MDKRRHYILVVDTETANTLVGEDGRMDMRDVLVYDCGWAVVDKHGNVYETASYVNKDIFLHERELMRSSYYCKKIPQYCADIREGRRKMVNTYEVRQAMLDTICRWNIQHIAAYNARFDNNGLNRTQSYVTASKFRYWFPFDSVVWWDILRMAREVILPMPTYNLFCQKRGYLLSNGKPRMTAEIVYRFISGDHDFSESHTGLEDVMIEKDIMAYCFRQKKAMTKELYPNAKERPSLTDFQKQIFSSLRQCPVIRI